MNRDGFYVQETKFYKGYLDGETISESYHETLESAQERLQFLWRAYEANGWKVTKYEPTPGDGIPYEALCGKFGGFNAEKDGVDYEVFVCIDSAEDVM